MSNILRPATAFSLSPGTRKRPRVKADTHLDYIRSLPCLICGTTYDIHAAHVRASCIALGKHETGAARKPDDRWSLPLCSDHHVFGPDAQHARGEMQWWAEHGINPFITALALWGASGDYEAGLVIVMHASERK